jgi:hypothetical protein
MSDRISICVVDLPAVLFDFDRVCGGSFGSFLVRNWCGSQLVINPTAPVSADTVSGIRREADFLGLRAGAFGVDPLR